MVTLAWTCLCLFLVWGSLLMQGRLIVRSLGKKNSVGFLPHLQGSILGFDSILVQGPT